MEDCGLKSYQDIREPEEPEYEMPMDEPHRVALLKVYVAEFFSDVMDVQSDTKASLWFDWMPDKVMVYTTTGSAWHHSGPIEMIAEANLDEIYESSIEHIFDELHESLWDWRDKKLGVDNG